MGKLGNKIEFENRETNEITFTYFCQLFSRNINVLIYWMFDEMHICRMRIRMRIIFLKRKKYCIEQISNQLAIIINIKIETNIENDYVQNTQHIDENSFENMINNLNSDF